MFSGGAREVSNLAVKQELKAGWKPVKFGDVVKLSRSRCSDPEGEGIERYVGLEHIEPENLRIRSWGLVKEGTTFTYLFRPGQVLFGKRRAYQRKVAIADFEGVCSGDIYVFESADPKFLLPELLPFLCQTKRFFEYAVSTSAGSLSPRTNWKSLVNFEFALPPLKEQKRIAELLTVALKAVEASQNVFQATQNILRAQQRYFFFDSREGKKIHLGQIATVQNGTTPSRKRTDYWVGTIPWLPTGKVNERSIFESEEFITKKALNECSLNIIPKGSTLIAMIGQGQTRGKAARLEIDACINQNFGAVIPGKKVDDRFIFYQLESNYEKLRAWSHGTNQHALNCKLIKTFPVLIPSLERQKVISTQMRTTDFAIHKAEIHLEKTRTVFSQLRDDALSK